MKSVPFPESVYTHPESWFDCAGLPSLRLLIGNAFDLDFAIHHHAGNDSSASWRVGGEVLAKDVVECLEIARIVEPDSAAHQVFRTISCFFEDGEKIPHRLMSLSRDVAFDELSVQDWNLPGNIKPTVC